MAGRVYKRLEGDRAYTELEIPLMPEDEQVQLMVDWFLSKYQDPVHRLPYNSREGGYQWVFGGPVEANETLQDEFSALVELSVIERAVEEIESEGTLEWSPSPDDDFYDDASDGVFDINAPFPDIVDGDGDWPPVVVVPELDAKTPRDDRSDFFEALQTLQEVLEARPRIPGIGHNRPPSPIEQSPLTEGAINVLITNISDLKDETVSEKPNPEAVNVGLGALRKVLGQVAAWIGNRATKTIDAFLVAGAAATGAKIAWSWDFVRHLLDDAVHFGQAWLNSLF